MLFVVQILACLMSQAESIAVKVVPRKNEKAVDNSAMIADQSFLRMI